MKVSTLRSLVLCLLLFGGLSPSAFCQAEASANPLDAVDVQARRIDSLNTLIEEMRLRELMLSDRLEESDRSAREDSVRRLHQRLRVDSLRKVTRGVPVVVDGDTLFRFYASQGGSSPRQRADEVSRRVSELGRQMAFRVDTMHVYNGDYTSDVMNGDVVIVQVNDLDALWAGKGRGELAAEHLKAVEAKLEALHEEYGFQAKLKAILMGVLVILIQAGLIWLTNWLYRRLKAYIRRLMHHRLRPVSFRGYELLNVKREARALSIVANWLRWGFILLQLTITVPILFAFFPETENVAYTLFGYILSPIKDILWGVVMFIPNILKIAIIATVFHYLSKSLKYFAGEIATEKLKIPGFYPDWAHPTYQLLRVLLFCFMFVMIWPLLPNSDSEEFKGVSVFIGLVVSLGSTGVVSNLVAGLVMTYMRPFKLGDCVEISGTKGVVVEKSTFVTRIRTSKADIVTIPNSNIMSAQVVNYTAAMQRDGVIVWTEVTIGYSEPREKIEGLLLAAAQACTLLKHKPAPFVLVTALEDFYVRYQINAYTSHTTTLSRVYSELHKQILDKFHAAGVEIMSPHYVARRDGEAVQIPAANLTAPVDALPVTPAK